MQELLKGSTYAIGLTVAIWVVLCGVYVVADILTWLDARKGE